MSDAELIKWVVANVGVCGLLFLVWYFYHKAQTKAWSTQQESQAEQQRLQLEVLAEQHKLQLHSQAEHQKVLLESQAEQQKVQLDAYGELIRGHREREDKNFQIMERFAETLEYHGACLARIETKIDQNKFCPIARKENGQ